jgi:hypothetical protein
MRDDLGDQVKRAIRGQRNNTEDPWTTATTEPPDALDQAPECAWCPICRAARRMAQAQAQAAAQAAAKSSVRRTPGRDAPARDTAARGSAARDAAGPGVPGAPGGHGGPGVPGWYGAADALVGAARDALSGLDAILSYRPQDAGSASPQDAGSADSGTSANPADGRDQAGADEASTGDKSEKSEHGPDHRG